jgi:hypothetical protein
VLRRVSRAAWRLDQAERERAWALASARAEGVSIRKLAAAAALSPARVHQITAAADLDELDVALGELRGAGWPDPEDPDADNDAELDGRDLICDHPVDEVGWIRQCADWLTHLHTSQYPPAVNLRPDGDHPDKAVVVVDLPRVAAILQQIAPVGTTFYFTLRGCSFVRQTAARSATRSRVPPRESKAQCASLKIAPGGRT